MEAVLALVPEEQQVQYSAMTGQSLFYMGESDLKHKVLAIVEEEGALRTAYALKLLQSEGVLTIASTGKDATTGRLITHQYRVEGPGLSGAKFLGHRERTVGTSDTYFPRFRQRQPDKAILSESKTLPSTFFPSFSVVASYPHLFS